MRCCIAVWKKDKLNIDKCLNCENPFINSGHCQPAAKGLAEPTEV